VSTNNCSHIIENLYSHPELNEVLGKIKPDAIRDDLRQELALTLLGQPCEKISRLFASNSLLRYAIKILYNMAIGNGTAQHAHSITHSRKEMAQALRYMYATRPLPELPKELGTKAAQVLLAKNKDKYDYHEQQIFWKYVELGTCRKVSQFFGILKSHVQLVVKKVRTEIKTELNDY